jgi:DegV family protein with EDD domain
MPPITILTDSAAQFVHPAFPGKELVQVIPLIPTAISRQDEFRLAAMSDQEIQVILKEVSESSAHVIAILSSGYLSALPNQIYRLLKDSSAAPRLVVIDSLSTGIGTGYLVEKAAELAVTGKSHSDVEQSIREYCTTIYTAVILPDLASLVPIGLVDTAQANAASILGIQSVFSMEEGLPTPLVKVRTRRSAYEYLVEFIDEFEKFNLIAAVHDSASDTGDLQIITDHLNEFFPGMTVQSFPPNSAWKTIFGENSYGLVIVSNEENNS